MPAAGLEPARGCPQQILSLPRLPFRHAGAYRLIYYHIVGQNTSFFCMFSKFRVKYQKMYEIISGKTVILWIIQIADRIEKISGDF